ncbi:MAG: hypothetical protein VYB09_08690 [Planctomycetota bacterium]|nr:hypothetical protein [Planctomycetota bacterium]
MASRENTTIQVALILSVMLVVVLGVFTYLFWDKSKTSVDEQKQLQSKVNDMINKNNVNEVKIMSLKFMIGDPQIKRGEVDSNISALEVAGGLDDVSALLTKFDGDMELYGQGMPEETRSYASIPENLLQTIKQQNDLNTKLEKTNRQLAIDKSTTVQTESELTASALTAKSAAESDRDSERTAFNTDRQRITKEKVDQKTTQDQQIAAANQKTATFKEQVDALEVDAETLQGTITSMKILRQPKSERFENPDGRITMVHQQNNTVWLDLGAAHGLKELTTFSVYDIKQPGVMHEKSDIKAKIQVTRILDLRLAEARILEDDITNPILRGDLIHSPVFQAATQIHFALAGFFDLDSDGEDDYEAVRSMISMVGGVIDAEIKPDGERVGKVTVNTRYLIKGSKTLENNKTYTDLIREVHDYDVEQITFPTFLKYVGYKREVLSVSLGRGADSSQFLGDLEKREIAPTLPDETRKQGFPVRRAPERGEDGAF